MKKVYTSKADQNTHSLPFYKSGRKHLADEFLRIDALIHLHMLKYNVSHPDEKINEFSGLYITREEINNILSRKQEEPGKDHPEKQEIEELVVYLDGLKKKIPEKINRSLEHGIYLPLYQLSYLFHLRPFELDIILICFAPETDTKYEKIFAYLNDDVTKINPSVKLITELLCYSQEETEKVRLFFLPGSPLFKYQIVTVIDDTMQNPLWSRRLKLDDRIVNFLLGYNIPDVRISPFTKIMYPQRMWSDVFIDNSLKERLIKLSTNYFKTEIKDKCIFYFCGPPGTGKKLTAEVFCRDLKLSLIIVDIPDLLMAGSDVEQLIRLLYREALLQPAVIYLDCFDQLLVEDRKYIHYQNIIAGVIDELSFITILAGNKRWNPPARVKRHTFMYMEFPAPSYPVRKKLWKHLTGGKYPLSPDVHLDTLAGTFHFTGGQIHDAVIQAGNLAKIGNGQDQHPVTMADLCDSCRNQTHHKLNELARKILPHYSWNDIVLPEDKLRQLREICNYVKYRHIVYFEWGFDQKLSLGKGLNILFAGPSGTGKTMAAEIIAGELHLDLYKIDLSCIVSKYIGETEKNLSKIFKEAEAGNAILFFDEADALFGKRSEVKDSHDRYANIEINYLLQKMEEHQGVVILATNFQRNIDDAFTRRLHFSVGFPFPDGKYRFKIWEKIFPDRVPVENDIDISFLAENFKISGGNIKNIALNAAFLAADNTKKVGMNHIIRAIKREYQKMSKLCVAVDFGKYYDLVFSKEEEK